RSVRAHREPVGGDYGRRGLFQSRGSHDVGSVRGGAGVWRHAENSHPAPAEEDVNPGDAGTGFRFPPYQFPAGTTGTVLPTRADALWNFRAVGLRNVTQTSYTAPG